MTPNKFYRTSTDIYRKDTNTGQYASFTSYEPWPRKIAWARALFHRTSRICDNNSPFQRQISVIKTFLSWNGFPRLLRLTSLNVSCVVALSQVHPTMIIARLIWLGLPYAGYIGESIVNRLVPKLKRCFKEPVCFKNFYQAKKLSSFCMNKDPNPMYLKSHVIYKLTCPPCNAEYIGKTDRCLRVRLDEHNPDYNSAMFQHLHSCEAFKFSFL